MTLTGYQQCAIVGSVLGSLSTFLCAVRLFTRVRRYGSFGLDDLFVCIAYPFVILQTVLYIIEGYRFARVLQPDPPPLEYFKVSQKIGLTTDMVYLWAVGAIKLSFLFFYRRLFSHLRFRYVVDTGLVFLVLYHTGLTLLLFFQCKPFSYYWDQVDPQVQGSCFDVYMQALIVGTLNIATDFLILILPLRIFYSLQASLKTKLLLGLLFGTGAFICVTSILRLYFAIKLIHAKATPHPLHVHYFILWSMIGVHVALICVNLPACKSFFTDYQKRKVERQSKRDYESRNMSLTLQGTQSPMHLGVLDTPKDESQVGTIFEFLASDPEDYMAATSASRKGSARLGYDN